MRQAGYPDGWVYRPIGIELELTNKCNIQCAGCGQRDEPERPEDSLSVDEYIEIARQASELPIFAASVTGGETLMFLDRVLVLLRAFTPLLDVYKINTNGYRFVNKELTRNVLTSVRDAGFGTANRYTKSVFVVSIGQQSNAGIPIQNSVNLASVFYDIFTPDHAVCSVNVTDKNIQVARSWSRKFRELYEKETGKPHDDRAIPIREFMLNTIATLRRLDLELDYGVTVPELFDRFSDTYRSWKCLNSLPDDNQDITTLMPKLVVRPNGDIMACPGYGYVHKIGNIKKKTLRTIIRNANENPVLRMMYTEGLPGLYKMAKKRVPSIANKKFSISHDPCDICKILTDTYNTALLPI
jgi:sulfatase maturation enzyme AslB (radical SAM superfamily)